MQYARITSNAKRTSADIDAVNKSITKNRSDVLERPEQTVMADVSLDVRSLAFVEIYSIGNIDKEHNQNTLLDVPHGRIFANLVDITPSNFGVFDHFLTLLLGVRTMSNPT